MVVDFQHHYIPVELAKRRGLYSENSNTMLKEGGLPATTMHRRLYDLDLQLQDMDEAGVDVLVLSCLLGWSASLAECRFINDDLAPRFRENIPSVLSDWPRHRCWKGKQRLTSCGARSKNWGARRDDYFAGQQTVSRLGEAVRFV